MSGFLSKSRQKLDHTSKLPFTGGEFKLLANVISTEKTVLTSHARAGTDVKKASTALEEWTASEGPDLSDTIGKVAKLLGNDLAKAEEEFAEHLSTYRIYFKSLRTREEQFSTLKKNKDSLQNKIDNAEKKISKMNPEHKDLPNLTNKLSDLRNEMMGMEQAVIKEDAAIGDFRRQTAKSAMSHKLGAICQLGEKLSIIGELGKLLVAEVPIVTTEPGHERHMYNSYDRTQQIYGEAQTCLHQVVFDSGSGESQSTQLPVPQREDFDQSYEYEQEAARTSFDRQQQQQGQPLNTANSSQPSQYLPPIQVGDSGFSPVDRVVSRSSLDRSAITQQPVDQTYHLQSQPQYQTAQPSDPYAHQQQQQQYQYADSQLPPGAAAAIAAGEGGISSKDYQPLPAPQVVENEFADAVNAGWQNQDTSYHQQHQPAVDSAPDTSTAAGSQYPSAQAYSQAASYRQPAQEHQHPSSSTSGNLSRDQYDHSYSANAAPVDNSHLQSIPSIMTTLPSTQGINTHSDSQEHSGENNHPDFKQYSEEFSPHDAPYPAPSGTPYDTGTPYEEARSDFADYEAVDNAQTAPSNGQSHHGQQDNLGTARYNPSGEDLSGTGLYGAPSEQREPILEERAGPGEALPTHRFETTPSVMQPIEEKERHEEEGTSPASPVIANQTSVDPSTVPPPRLAQASLPRDAASEKNDESHTSGAYAPTSGLTSSPTAIAPQLPLLSEPAQQKTVQPERRVSSQPDPIAKAVMEVGKVPSSPNKVSHSSSSKPKSPPPGISTQNLGSSSSKASPITAPGVNVYAGKSRDRKASDPISKRASLSKSGSDYGRSSIAYLNEPPPRIEPPMRAPPPVTSGLPLPSASPYFNPYASLRSSSQGNISPSAGDASTKVSKTGKSDRADARADTTLGSRFGHDMKAVSPPEDKALRQQPSPNANPSAVTQKDYTYAIKTDHGDGGRRLNAGAFRRAPASSNSVNSAYSSAPADGAVSPAARLRDEWRASAYVAPTETPALQVSTHGRDSREVLEEQGMYNASPAESRANFTHRTSAIDAPTDVVDDYSQPSSAVDEVLPLNVRKKSAAGEGQQYASEQQPHSTGAGFGDNRYVTRLD